MSEDINYCPGTSIYADGIQTLEACHKPCPSMGGLDNYDPEKTERSLSHIDLLRQKLRLKKRDVKQVFDSPLDYVCTDQKCLDPWDLRTASKRKNKPKDEANDRWRSRLKVNANNLPNRLIKRQENHETAQH